VKRNTEIREDWPRERLKRAASALELSSEDLLAVLLKTGTPGCDVWETAHRLLSALTGTNAGRMTDLGWRAIAAAIAEHNARNPEKPIKGIGEVKLLELAAAFELSKRVATFTEDDFRRVNLRSSAAAFRVFSPFVAREDEQEHFYVLPMDSEFHPICRPILVHKGSVADVRVYPRDVFCEAIRWRAYAVIVAHNHPNGDPTPSDEDVALTKELIEIGKLHRIPVIDHLVLAARANFQCNSTDFSR